MPFYDYNCLSCQHTFEEFLSIAQRKKPESKPCPMCGEIKIKQMVTSPNVSVDSQMDIHKAKGGFKEAMMKVSEAPGIKGSKRSRELKDRYNL